MYSNEERLTSMTKSENQEVSSSNLGGGLFFVEYLSFSAVTMTGLTGVAVAGRQNVTLTERIEYDPWMVCGVVG